MSDVTTIDYRLTTSYIEAERIIGDKMSKVHLRVLTLNRVCREYFRKVKEKEPAWRFEFFRTNSKYKFRRIAIKCRYTTEFVIVDESRRPHQLNMSHDITIEDLIENPEPFEPFMNHINGIIMTFRTATTNAIPSVYDSEIDDEDEWS